VKVGDRHFISFPAARWRGRDGRPSRGLGRAKGHPSRPIIVRDDPASIGQWSNCLCPIRLRGKEKWRAPFLGARQVSGRGKTTRWGSEENLRSRNERAVTWKAACSTVRRRSMGLWSKFDPDKSRALIHLMSKRRTPCGVELGRMRLIRRLRFNLRVTDSQSVNSQRRSPHFP
jgi:hypothetical protein